jgi:hypothetical protein
MRKIGLVLIAGAALATGACTTTGTGNSRLDGAVEVCEIGLRGLRTAGEVATVLESNGFVPEQAHKIADKAFQTGDVAAFVCQTLIAANAIANSR